MLVDIIRILHRIPYSASSEEMLMRFLFLVHMNFNPSPLGLYPCIFPSLRRFLDTGRVNLQILEGCYTGNTGSQ